jgi:aspartyl-tRNA(Asn)/glutamyl-tRNA(Gln) amidotransferase subunit B
MTQSTLDIRSAHPSQYFQGRTGPWELVIGLEVHAQVASKTKLFSGAKVGFGAGPNEHVSFIDAAMPGMLPVVNRFCVEQAIKTGLGLKAEIHRVSRFDRKNYFYPDLPQGYQISQLFHPIVGEGLVLVELDAERSVVVRIERLHLEQDAGKSIHDLDPHATYVDLNRAGTALMEIVSKPDMRSADEAVAYFKKLRTILIYLGTCDGDMEKGNMRADCNVSVRRPGEGLGTRCEIKNVNSFRFMQQAIEYEARRQIEIIEDGGSIEQETRLFDAQKVETRSMRSKEEAHDYRYFPDPDLLPLIVSEEWIEALRRDLVELPDEKKARFISQYGLSAYDAGVLISDQARAAYFEEAAIGRDAKLIANWIANELLARLTKDGLEIDQSPLDPHHISGLVELIENQTISSKIAKTVFDYLWEAKGALTASEIVDKHGLKQVTDTGAIEKAIDDIISQNPDKAGEVKTKPQALGWFVGQVMRATGGKANPASVNELLKAKLGL